MRIMYLAYWGALYHTQMLKSLKMSMKTISLYVFSTFDSFSTPKMRLCLRFYTISERAYFSLSSVKSAIMPHLPMQLVTNLSN